MNFQRLSAQKIIEMFRKLLGNFELLWYCMRVRTQGRSKLDKKIMRFRIK